MAREARDRSRSRRRFERWAEEGGPGLARPHDEVLARLGSLRMLELLAPPDAALGGSAPPVDDLLSFECDFLALKPADLAAGARDVLRLFLDRDEVNSFVRTMQWNYHQCNPYHNFAHGVSVQCHVAAWLRTPEIGAFFDADQQAALVVAALGHDVGHPGVMQDFVVRTGTPLSRVYLEQPAILERHHVHQLLETLRAPGCDVFAGWSEDARQQARKTMVRAILATSLDDHHRQVEELRAVAKAGDVAGHRALVEDVLVHAADLSANSMGFQRAHAWNKLVLAEFGAQRDLEIKRGLTPQGLLLNDPREQGWKVTIGFMKHVAQPLFVAAAEIFPASFGPRRARLADNVARYEEMAQTEDGSTAR